MPALDSQAGRRVMARLDELARFSGRSRGAYPLVPQPRAPAGGGSGAGLDERGGDARLAGCGGERCRALRRADAGLACAAARLAHRHGAQCRQVRRQPRRGRGNRGGGGAAPGRDAPAFRHRGDRVRRRGGRALSGDADRLAGGRGHVRSGGARRGGRGRRDHAGRPGTVRLRSGAHRRGRRGSARACSAIARCTSSKGRCWRRRTCRSASSPPSTARAASRSNLPAWPDMRAPCRWTCGATPCAPPPNAFSRSSAWRGSRRRLVGTVGRIEALPGAINVIPSAARASPSTSAARATGVRADAVAQLSRGIRRDRRAAAACSSPCGRPTREAGRFVRSGADQPARAGASRVRGCAPLTLPSGAGHDGMAMVALCPIGDAVRALRRRHQPQSRPRRSPQKTPTSRSRVLLDFLRHFDAGASLMSDPTDVLRAFLAGERDRQVAFLAELVRDAIRQSAGRLRAARRAHGDAAGGARASGRAASGAGRRGCAPTA